MDNEIISFTGLLFQIQGAKPTKELWDECKISACKEISKQKRKGYAVCSTSFYSIFMPCGSYMEFDKPQNIIDLPIEDIPCPCGDKTHWLVRFIFFD